MHVSHVTHTSFVRCHVFSSSKDTSAGQMMMKFDDLGAHPAETLKSFHKSFAQQRESDILEDGTQRGKDCAQFHVKFAVEEFVRVCLQRKTVDDHMGKFSPAMKFPVLRDIKKMEMGTKHRKLVPPECCNHWSHQVPEKK